MLELLKDIYNHPKTSDTLKTYMSLRLKQLFEKDEELTSWMKDVEESE